MCVDFHEWITRKYVEWRGDAIGNERSVTEFAAWIGVSQPLMSSWMKKGGKIPRSKKAIDALSKAFGLEVYDVLGLPRPDPLDEIEQLLETLPEQQQDQALDIISQWLENLPEQKQDLAIEKMESILARRAGWRRTGRGLVDPGR
jgi:hypothetical protein